MLKLRPLSFQQKASQLCYLPLRYVAQQRLLLYRHASQTAKPKPVPPPQPSNSKKEEDHIPQPLNRLLGFDNPPQLGENDGIDHRSWYQRRDDFFDYEKHLERRQILTKKVAKPYFREWSNMRFSKGKSFLAPVKLFRADKALYFPNLRGVTLAEPKDPQDTTFILQGKISVVCVFSGSWAESQTTTFFKGNEKLEKVLKAGSGLVQRVDINREENSMKAALIKIFMGNLRRNLPVEQHARYFLVRRGFTEDIRLDMGILNGQVGYVFLLDSECRIRWAGSAEAGPGEQDSLVRGVAKLVQEFRKRQESEDDFGVDLAAALVESVFNAVNAIVE